MKTTNDTIPPKADRSEITCYKTVIPTNSLEKIKVKGLVHDKWGEALFGVCVSIKGNQTLGTVTDANGNFSIEATDENVLVFSFIGFKTKEVPVFEFIADNEPIVMEEEETIMCYEVIVVPAPDYDDIYARRPKRITQLSYTDIQTPPVSPVGNLADFQEWINKHVLYNERMLKDKTQGDVILRFAVDKTGKIVNKKVIGKLSSDADKEALRVLSSCGNWKPGEQMGKKIKTTLTITVNFKMPE
jgi:TonB family protein